MSSSSIWTLEDGEFRSGGSVPLTDRAFRYGMSVFETIAVRGGRFLLLQEHMERLHRASEVAGFPLPPMGELPRGIPDGVLRIYVTAGDGPPTASAESVRVFLLFDEASFPTNDEVGKGFQLSMSRAPLSLELGGWKTGNYWPRVQALGEARRVGADESLVFNAQGALIGASMANVFLMLGDRVVTPALCSGARDGAVRHWLMTRIPVEEALLTVEDVESAGECFLTNSRLGVMPVAAIEGRTLPSRKTGQSLADLYREEIQ